MGENHDCTASIASIPNDVIPERSRDSPRKHGSHPAHLLSQPHLWLHPSPLRVTSAPRFTCGGGHPGGCATHLRGSSPHAWQGCPSPHTAYSLPVLVRFTVPGTIRLLLARRRAPERGGVWHVLRCGLVVTGEHPCGGGGQPGCVSHSSWTCRPCLPKPTAISVIHSFLPNDS